MPLPQREDTIVHGVAGTRHLPLLRLWQGRQCRELHHGARADDISRGAQVAGKEIPYRDKGAGADGRGTAGAEREGVDVHRQRLGGKILRADPSRPSRRQGHWHAVLPLARLPRRHHTQVPAGLRPQRPAGPGQCSRGQGLQPRLSAQGRTVLQERPWPAHRPLCRKSDVPVDRSERKGGGVRRQETRLGHQGGAAEICIRPRRP